MKTNQGKGGRISDHSQGIGIATSDMVERRAKELAIINGRGGQKVTEDDWLQARRELSGQPNLTDQQNEEPIEGLTTWNEKPDTSDHRVENSPESDEETVAERLTREGVEEANHDLMLKGNQSDTEEVE